MKKLNQVVLMLLFGLKLSGQFVSIDSVYTIPNSPTAEDTIWVVGAIRTASAGCDLINTEFESDTISNVLKISSCYAIGPMDTICPSVDTFFIGQLHEGNYQIIMAVKGLEIIVTPSGDCSSLTNEAIKEIGITVSGTISTNGIEEEIGNFILMENPVEGFATFRINSNNIKTKLFITDSLGRVVATGKIEGIHGEEVKIEIKQLPTGIYYCYLENASSKSKSIKMVKK